MIIIIIIIIIVIIIFSFFFSAGFADLAARICEPKAWVRRDPNVQVCNQQAVLQSQARWAADPMLAWVFTQRAGLQTHARGHADLVVRSSARRAGFLAPGAWQPNARCLQLGAAARLAGCP